MRKRRSFKLVGGGKKRPSIGRRDRLILTAGFAAGLIAGAGTILWPTLSESAEALARTIATAIPRQAPLIAIDGDTFRDRRTGVIYRLANIDTPETGDRARCTAEREAAAEATAAARALIASARGVVVKPAGRIDQYGRTIAYIEVDGHDLGDLMIDADHARPWRGRREPWCDANGGLIR